MNKDVIRSNILSDYQQLTTPHITKTVRNLVAVYKQHIKQLSIEDTFHLTESFLKDETRKYTLIAYQILDYNHSKLTRESFKDLERIVYTYISDWWDCDDFMTHTGMRFYLRYKDILPHVEQWTTHERFAVRRCVPVLLVVPARKGLVPIDDVFHICDILLEDPHYLVQKGYGWLLKEASKQYQSDVINYLETHHKTMPRTAFRYALEKLPKLEKERLMSL